MQKRTSEPMTVCSVIYDRVCGRNTSANYRSVPQRSATRDDFIEYPSQLWNKEIN